MKKKGHITAFYMEMLVLTAVFIIVILILTQVFALSRGQSAKAKTLTDSVCLAENAAELMAGAGGEDAFLALLGKAGNVQVSEEGGHKRFQARYDGDMNPAPGGDFLVDVEWIPQAGSEAGNFVKGVITVYWGQDPEPVYILETGVLLR